MKGEGTMDRRIDVETLRTGLDEVLAGLAADVRVVIQKNGRDAFVLTGLNPPASESDWLAALQAEAAANGVQDMTMDEIDAEIDAYRREKAAAAR